jgi:hypothetical protein
MAVLVCPAFSRWNDCSSTAIPSARKLNQARDRAIDQHLVHIEDQFSYLSAYRFVLPVDAQKGYLFHIVSTILQDVYSDT